MLTVRQDCSICLCSKLLILLPGVRTFKSFSAASSFQYIGGPSAILSLVAMASDDGSLYAAVKVLLSVLETNPVMEQEMKRTNGYKVVLSIKSKLRLYSITNPSCRFDFVLYCQLLSFLLKMKSQLISFRIFQLILSIVGTMELGIVTTSIPNISAFQDVLCDFEVSFRLVCCMFPHSYNIICFGECSSFLNEF